MEANEVKSNAASSQCSRTGLGAPEKIALTTLILFFGISMFVYVAHAGTPIVAAFISRL